MLPGLHTFDGIGIAPDLEITTASERSEPIAQGCSPVGEKLATIRYRSGEPDPTLVLATRIITMAPSAARADLLAAAKSVAIAPAPATRTVESTFR